MNEEEGRSIHTARWMIREKLSTVISPIAKDRISNVSRLIMTELRRPTSSAKIVDALIRACPDELLLEEVSRILNEDERAAEAFKRGNANR